MLSWILIALSFILIILKNLGYLATVSWWWVYAPVLLLLILAAISVSILGSFVLLFKKNLK